MKRTLLILSIAILFFTSCKKEDLGPNANPVDAQLNGTWSNGTRVLHYPDNGVMKQLSGSSPIRLVFNAKNKGVSFYDGNTKKFDATYVISGAAPDQKLIMTWVNYPGNTNTYKIISMDNSTITLQSDIYYAWQGVIGNTNFSGFEIYFIETLKKQ